MNRCAFLAIIALSWIVSCAPTPTAQPRMEIVTRVVTPTSQVIVVTATPGPQEIQPASTPTPQAIQLSPSDISKIKEGIQPTLALYAQAYNQNDPDLLTKAVDQTNLPFRRFVRTRFDTYQKSFLGGQLKFSYAVQDVKLRDFGFVQARIRISGDGEAAWFFRQVDGTWVVSEPTSEQLGEPNITEHVFSTFYTWSWADDVNNRVIQLVENARERVRKKLGKVPDQQATVKIKPIYGLTPFDDPFAVAYYGSARSSAELDRIEIFAPHSYGFGSYDAMGGWEKELQDILTHEYTHMTHKRSFDNAGNLMSWVTEGLAEYVSDELRTYQVRAAVQSGNIIPIVDTSSRVYKQDLMHLELLERDRSLAFGFSVSLVVYITQNYGGLEGFWKFVHAYDDKQDIDAALRQAFGIGFDQFDRDWRAWLKKY